MTCSFVHGSPCRAYPICWTCGQCGKHCRCEDSPAQDAAGRTDVARIRELHLEETERANARVARYQKRWTDLKRAFDIALLMPRMEAWRYVEAMRKSMDRHITWKVSTISGEIAELARAAEEKRRRSARGSKVGGSGTAVARAD